MTPDRFRDGIQWWMDITRPMSEALFPNPPQWHIDTGNLVRLVPQREWVGLTAEETSGFTQHEMTVVKYVSKVLQEKNA